MKMKVGFLGVSVLLMGVYLIAIAAVNPPWPVQGYDSDSGSWTDGGQTVYCNTYVAYNYVWDSDCSCWNARTYHWAKVWNLPANGKIDYEFRHAWGVNDGYISGATVETGNSVGDGSASDQDGPGNNSWEHDNELTSLHSNPGVGQTWSWSPYTAVKKAGAGTWAAQSSVTITLPHH